MTPPIKYPWASWLDGNDKTLVAGEDFAKGIQTINLAAQIRDRARRQDITMSVRRTRGRKDEIVLAFGDGDRLVGRYPWETWLDGEQHVIGFDEIGSQPESFRRYAWLMARQFGKKITVTVRTGQRLIAIKAIGPYTPTRSVASAAPSEEELARISAQPYDRGGALASGIRTTDFDSYRPLAARTSAEFAAAPADQDEPWPDDVDELITAERPS